MKTKFKLNTATRATGRIKGWSCQSDIDDTVKDVLTYHRAQIGELKAAIEAELVSARENLTVAEDGLNHPLCKRGTRIGKRNGARYDRAYHKVFSLERALEELNK